MIVDTADDRSLMFMSDFRTNSKEDYRNPYTLQRAPTCLKLPRWKTVALALFGLSIGFLMGLDGYSATKNKRMDTIEEQKGVTTMVGLSTTP